MARILIVDDEESIRYTFENFLAEEGHEIDTASDFDMAIEKMSRNDYDLIFADIILGGKTGIDLLQEVKQHKKRPAVVMVTGYPNIETASDAVRLGAFDYIPKPVRHDALIHIATLALQHKTLQDKAEQYRSNLEAIFRSVKDAIITVDKDLNVLEINEAAKKICGLGRDSIGKPFAYQRPDCRIKCLDVLQKTISGHMGFEISRAECVHNGHLRKIVTLNTSPLLDSHNLFSGAVIVIRDETQINNLERDLKQRRQHLNIIGKNEHMQKIYSLIEDLSDIQTTVLITGESGTGKELVADAIHYSGDRRDRPIIKVNCSALTESLLESELFGHVKGAFTGADKNKVGRFQKADTGTIFLDEIGDITPRMQLKLLRVLQERVFEPVGDSTPIKVDVRVIAATNQDLAEKVRKGEFRDDLYYRLNVVEIHVPPLRDRKDDIPLLTDHFLNRFNSKFNKDIKAISDGVLKIFLAYDWPGNIRELEHAMEHAFVLCKSTIIAQEHLPGNFSNYISDQTVHSKSTEVDPHTVRNALIQSGGNKAKAARLLGINVRTIFRKIEKYNINVE
ncbi:MAG: sigma 54-interacting transcriptional regulator [Nitrospiraceae bacterium]|nr:MAG: sigma 54-interacting transcriptional regulator [Nitrospiraceae bacterium]